MKADLLIGKKQTVVDKEERRTKRPDTNQPYYDVQAIVEGEGLVRYSTGAQLLVQELRSASLPMRDKVIQQDWRGLFFEGSVYTLEEEEERIRREFQLLTEKKYVPNHTHRAARTRARKIHGVKSRLILLQRAREVGYDH